MPYTYDPKDYDPEGGFTLPEIGPHRVRIIEAEERRSKGGNQMMEITAEIINGAAKGSRLWEYIVYNEYAGSKFGQILHACGKDPSVKRELKAQMFIGLEGTVQVKHETYEGQKRAKIHYWIRPEEALAEMEPEESDAGQSVDDPDIPF